MISPRRFLRRVLFRITKPLRPHPAWRTSLDMPLGKRGELYAADYLRDQGYLVIEEGYRNTYGEIDQVAIDDRTIVFVEVKTRAEKQGDPLAAVDAEKQKRMTRAGLAYLKHHKLLNHAARFDVIGLVWPAGACEPKLIHIVSAFEATGKWQMFS